MYRKIKKELDSISDSLNDLNKKRDWLYDDLLMLFKEIPSIKSFTFYWTDFGGCIEEINGIYFHWCDIDHIGNSNIPVEMLVRSDISECEFKKFEDLICELSEISKDLLLIHCNKYGKISLESIESAKKDSLNIKDYVKSYEG